MVRFNLGQSLYELLHVKLGKNYTCIDCNGEHSSNIYI